MNDETTLKPLPKAKAQPIVYPVAFEALVRISEIVEQIANPKITVRGLEAEQHTPEQAGALLRNRIERERDFQYCQFVDEIRKIDPTLV